MQHWVIAALRGAKNDHERAYLFGQRGSLMVAIRLPHMLSPVANKDIEFQVAFYNPTARSFAMKLDWQVSNLSVNLSGKCQIPVKFANGMHGAISDRVLATITAPLGTIVRGNAVVSDSKRSINSQTECAH